MKEEKKEEKKELKITRGANLNELNWLWLNRVASARTLARGRGTVSASEVLDEIVTAAREKGDIEDDVVKLLLKSNARVQ